MLQGGLGPDPRLTREALTKFFNCSWGEVITYPPEDWAWALARMEVESEIAAQRQAKDQGPRETKTIDVAATGEDV